MSAVPPGSPLIDPPTGPAVAEPPPGRGWTTRQAIGLAVAAFGAAALITWVITSNGDSDAPGEQAAPESGETSDVVEGDAREPQPVENDDAGAASAPVGSPPPTTAAPISVPWTPSEEASNASDAVDSNAVDSDAVDSDAVDSNAVDSDDAELQDLQDAASRLADADADDVLVLSLPASDPIGSAELQPLTATIRGDNVYLEGAAPSSEIGSDYERQATEIWGDKVVARYSVDSRAPVPRADDVVLEKPVLFEPGSARIDPEYLPVLDACFEFLTTYPSVNMVVAGHTDDVGSEEYNLRLAQQRADAIVAYYESLGLEQDRLVTVAAGEASPLAGNDTDEGREQNRRIDLSLVGALVAAAPDGPIESSGADNADDS